MSAQQAAKPRANVPSCYDACCYDCDDQDICMSLGCPLRCRYCGGEKDGEGNCPSYCVAGSPEADDWARWHT